MIPRLSLLALFLLGLQTQAVAKNADQQSYIRDGLAAYNQENYDSAIELFSRSISSNTPFRQWELFFRGKAYVRSGKNEAALKDFQKAAGKRKDLLSFECALNISNIHKNNDAIYSATARLLEFENSPTFGPEALYRSGKLLADHADTKQALNLWKNLVTLFPSSPFAHKAVLRLNDLPKESLNTLIDNNNYLALVMAQTAFNVGDYATTDLILDAVSRRALDRRIRSEILLLHGRALHRLSHYGKAIASFREAARYSHNAHSLAFARAGIILSELQRGDTVEPLTSLFRLPEWAYHGDFINGLSNVAALKRKSGDPVTAKSIHDRIDTPLFDEFLQSYEYLSGEKAPRTLKFSRERVYWDAYTLAERLSNRDDRSLALALLSQHAPSDTINSWRNVIYETDNEYLLLYAAKKVESLLPVSNPETLKKEARMLYTSASRAFNNGSYSSGIRRMNVVRYGYPNTAAAERAVEFEQRVTANLFTPIAGSNNINQTATWLLEVGAYDCAVLYSERAKDPSSQILLLKALTAQNEIYPVVELIAKIIDQAAWTVSYSNLPATIKKRFYPDTYTRQFKNAGRRFKIDPLLLKSLVREETKFDPTFTSSFRHGITALPVEVVDFSQAFDEAPRSSPIGLFIPDTAIELSAWYLSQISKAAESKNNLILAAAKYAGLNNITKAPNDSSELDFISRIPFQKARAFLLRFQRTIQLYQEKEL